MRLLLDTHVVIWLLEQPERVRRPVRAAVTAPSADVFISAASLLEIASKASAGRLDFGDEARAKADVLGRWLPVDTAHAWAVRRLPPIHKDPFDRVLVAQAMAEGLTLVTGDRLLADYGLPVLLT